MELKVGDTVRVKKLGYAMEGFSVGDICEITDIDDVDYQVSKGSTTGYTDIKEESGETLEFISRGSDKLKVGDKIVILKGAGKYPLNGFEPDVVYTVNDTDFENHKMFPNGCVEIMTRYGLFGYTNSSNLKNVSDKSNINNYATKGYIVMIEAKRGTSVVSCKLYVKGNLVRTTEAKCNPDDKFSIKTGAKLALDRMFPEKPHDKK